MTDELRGIFPIVYTPFNADGDIDEEDLHSLVDFLISAGAHGLAAVGGASECHKLTLDERRWLAEATISVAAGRVPVIVGTSAENTRTSVILSQHAEKVGARAVFLTPPTYGPLDPRSIKYHYRVVAQSVSIPIMIQHALIPISANLMAEIAAECENVRFVKEESEASGHMISEVLRLCRGRLSVFSGGSYLLDELARGAVGGIPGSMCVADLSRAFDLWMQGDQIGARRVFNHALPLLYGRRPAPLLWAKEVLRRQGVIKGAYLREPAGATLDEADRREIAAIMEMMGPPY